MKIKVTCMECFRINGMPSNDYELIEINDTGILEHECLLGHKNITVIQQQNFEILFTLAGMALLDGYSRESIVSIAASLERFYEFYIKVISIEYKINFEDFDSAWKNVKNQSERQYGAFIFTYLLSHNGQNPPLVDDEKPELIGRSKSSIKSWKSFRNDVVHKGYIPTPQETISYSEIVYSHMLILLEDLHNNFQESVKKVVTNHVGRSSAILQKSHISIPTIISLIKKHEDSYQTALESLKKYKETLYSK
ncbi:hypothetical protein AB3N62_11035 [Leptospira sp. WS4.C2]